MKRYYVMEDGSRREITQDYFATFSSDKIKKIKEHLKESIYKKHFIANDMLDEDTYRKGFTRFLEKIAKGASKKESSEKLEHLKAFYKLKEGKRSRYIFRCFDETYRSMDRIWLSGGEEYDIEDRWVAMYNIFSEIKYIKIDTVENWEILADSKGIELTLKRLMHGLTVESSDTEVVYKLLPEEEREKNAEYLERCWKEYVRSLDPNLKAFGMMKDHAQRIKNLKIDGFRRKELEARLLDGYFSWKNSWMKVIEYMGADETKDVDAAIREYDNAYKEWGVIDPNLVDDNMMIQFFPDLPIPSKKKKKTLQKELASSFDKHSTDMSNKV